MYHHRLEPLFKLVHNKMVLNIRQFKVLYPNERCIYSNKKYIHVLHRKMVIFFYIIHIFLFRYYMVV